MNKKIKFLFLGILALVGLFAGATPASAQTVIPTCSNAVWSATLYGTVTPNGTATQAWFEWGTNTSLSFTTPHQTFSTTSNYSQTLIPLTENTIYYWRSMAQNQYGTATGSTLSFSTGKCSTPINQRPVITLNGNSNININVGQTYTELGASAFDPEDGNITSRISVSGFVNSGIAGTYTITYNVSDSQGLAAIPVTRTVTVTSVTQVCTDFNATNYGGALPCTYQTLAPTATISADSTNIAYNDSTIVRWSSTNATSCTASNGANGWASPRSLSGSFATGALTNATTFTISCYNSTGQQANSSITISVNGQAPINGGWSSWSAQDYSCGASGIQTRTCTNPSPANGGSYCSGVSTQSYTNPPCNNNQNPTVTIYANPSSVSYNGSSTIIWNSQNAISCNGTSGTNGWLGTKGTSGTFYTGVLNSSTNYFSITCTNYNGQSAYASTTVNVDTYQQTNVQPTVATYNATSITTTSATLNGFVNGSGLYTIAWFVYGTNTNFGYTTNQNSYGSGYSNYSAPISGLIPNTIYYFRAVAQSTQGLVYGNTLSFNTTNNYISTNNNPTVQLFADQTSIPYNGATTVRWITTNATSCTASGGSVGWAGIKSIGPGSFYTGSITGSKTYEITCSNNYGYASDTTTLNVRGQILGTTTTAPTSLVLITSSVNRNQPIVPTIDNTRPKPGDEINYTVSYQNIGNASITGLNLRINLPLEVDYMSSNPNNPIISGNSLIFNLGTLKANGEGTVTIRTKVRENIPTGTNLNFPATLSYIDPSGNPQSVSANVSAQVWNENSGTTSPFGANAFWSGVFLPGTLLGWLLLIIVILALILLAKYIFANDAFKKRTVTTVDNPQSTKTTTTTIQ